jgi:4-amino-4-deoxy-L-arabinose transferase-like glycosyltransferase
MSHAAPGGAVAPAPSDTVDRGTRSGVPLTLYLAAHALVWTLATWVSSCNLDANGDMVENYVWGIEWQAGYSKHPPLFAWITAAWFSVFPRTELAYFALSSLNAAVGLLGVAALARRFLPADTAAFAALALGMSPLYTALAMKFNANAVQLSVWPWAAVAFVAFMQEGRLRHAAAYGALAGLALLGKYFSVVLLLALPIAALAVPAWRKRLRGAGAGLALLVGVVVMVPHGLWMVEQEFTTLRFAAARSAGELVPALQRLANFTAAQVVYLAPSLIFLLLATRPGQRREAARRVAAAFVEPSSQRELWWLALAPMFVIAAIAALHRTEMASVWGMAQWFAVTAWWLAVLARHGIEPRAEWLPRALPAIWIAVLVLSVGVGAFEARRGSEDASSPQAELTQAAQAAWRERVKQPLRIVGGSLPEAHAIAFYGDGKIRWWNPMAPATTPWLSVADVRRDGALLVCADGDLSCERSARELVAAPPVEVSVHKTSWGIDEPPRAYQLYLLPPP